MASPSLGRLLISHITLRGPEMQQLYTCITDSPDVSYEDLVRVTAADSVDGDRFGLQEAALREALNFLLVTRLIEQHGPARRRATFRPTNTSSNIPFPLLMLEAIVTHPDSRQRAITTLHRQLIMQDTLAMTASDIRNEAERDTLGSLFAWTGEKVSFWARFCEHLGMVRHLARDGQLVFVPRTDLVLAAIQCALTGRHAGSLAECLNAIDTEFFACYTRRGAVHSGLTQTLIALHRLGIVTLSHSSDARQSLLLGDWRVSDVALVADAGEAR